MNSALTPYFNLHFYLTREIYDWDKFADFQKIDNMKYRSIFV